METGEFLLLSQTSSLTLAIAGILKEVTPLAFLFNFLLP